MEKETLFKKFERRFQNHPIGCGIIVLFVMLGDIALVLDITGKLCPPVDETKEQQGPINQTQNQTNIIISSSSAPNDIEYIAPKQLKSQESQKSKENIFTLSGKIMNFKLGDQVDIFKGDAKIGRTSPDGYFTVKITSHLGVDINLRFSSDSCGELTRPITLCDTLIHNISIPLNCK